MSLGKIVHFQFNCRYVNTFLYGGTQKHSAEIETKFEQAYVYLILFENHLNNVYNAQMLGFMIIGQIKIRS